MAKTKRKWIQLDPNHPDALMAQHIYYTQTSTIGDVLDDLGAAFVRPESMAIDDNLTGVDNGQAFGIIETVDFSEAADGAVYFTVPALALFKPTAALSLIGVPNGTITEAKVVRFVADVWATSVGEAPTSIAAAAVVDLTVAPEETGKVKESAAALQVSVPETARLLTFKLTRLATAAEDTFDGTYQLIAAVVSKA